MARGKNRNQVKVKVKCKKCQDKGVRSVLVIRSGPKATRGGAYRSLVKVGCCNV